MRGRAFQKDGFVIWDTLVRKGESKKFIFSEPTSRADLPSCAFYAGGRFTFRKPDGEFVIDRLPGTFTRDRPDQIEPGEYVLTAEEDGSRWFCIESGQPFHAQKVDLSDRTSMTLLADKSFLLCMGHCSATVGILRTTMYHKPRDFIVASPFQTVLKGSDPITMGVMLWR